MMDVGVIETGLSCNNNCIFCYQAPLKAVDGQLNLDLPFEVLKNRLKTLRKKDIEICQLTGGEPTIRPDFMLLLETAKGLGFKQCAITTNARAFSSKSFTRKALQRGLSHVSVSILSADREVHDALSGSVGAFDQTVRGIKNLMEVSADLGIKLNIDSSTVLMKPNIAGLKELVVLLNSLGIRLFGLQPFVPSQWQRALMDKLYCDYNCIRQEVLRVIPLIRKLKTRIRLFNIPPCLFSQHLDVIELSKKHFTIAEYATNKENVAVIKNGFYKVDSCRGCGYPCPGFRIESMSQSVMIDRAVELLKKGDEELAIDNFELLSSIGWVSLLKRIQDVKVLPYIVIKPGLMRVNNAFLLELFRGKKGIKLASVIHPTRLRFPDRRIIEPGNELDALDFIENADFPVYAAIDMWGLDSEYVRWDSMLQSIRYIKGLILAIPAQEGSLDMYVLKNRLMELSEKLDKFKLNKLFFVFPQQQGDTSYLDLIRRIFNRDLYELKLEFLFSAR